MRVHEDMFMISEEITKSTASRSIGMFVEGLIVRRRGRKEHCNRLRMVFYATGVYSCHSAGRNSRVESNVLFFFSDFQKYHIQFFAFTSTG